MAMQTPASLRCPSLCSLCMEDTATSSRWPMPAEIWFALPLHASVQEIEEEAEVSEAVAEVAVELTISVLPHCIHTFFMRPHPYCRDEKVKVMRFIQPIKPEDCIIGQYVAGG